VEEIALILTESREQKEEIEKLCKENREKIIR
jgi:hypothetical protein